MEWKDFFTRKKEEIGVSLNETQMKGVLHTEGPLLILASPGSGKTTTIIMKIGYLIEEKGLSPSKILAVTFSRASAQDMKERYTRFFPHLSPVDFSTIHSLAFKIVRDVLYNQQIPYEIIEGDRQAGTAIRQFHKKILLRNLYYELNGENITEDQLEELTTYISYIKNKLLAESKWSEVACDVPKALEIFIKYEQFKRSGTSKLLLDYDDMLTMANKALEENELLLSFYQNFYDYILTDESQDTSLVQHKIIEKLVNKHKNLCVVADDDQSIYGWRAAEPQYLLNFKEIYPEAEILFMEQNYRSTKTIVAVANQFIKGNKDRYDKNMFTENEEGEKIRMTRLPDYIYQANYLIKQLEGEENLSNTAILFRNNSSSIMLMHYFDLAGVPFYIKDTDTRFFSHWIVEDILNFMRLSYNDKRIDIFEKVHSKLNAFISKKQLADLKSIQNGKSVFYNLLQHVPLKDYQKKQLHKCQKSILEMKGNTPREVLRIIRNDIGYEKVLENMSKRLGFRLEGLLEILNALEMIAESQETMEQFAHRLTYLGQLARESWTKQGENAVTFTTFHSSKGLEFERVFIVDLIEGIIPSKEDVKEAKEGKREKLEEARRLFYVAMTRAKRSLELITYKAHDGLKVKESSFLKEVERITSPREASWSEKERKDEIVKSDEIESGNIISSKGELEIDRLVKHRVFGPGKVISFQKDTIEIQFKRGMKKLSLDLCLEKKLLQYVDE